jgi:hypothetical protein
MPTTPQFTQHPRYFVILAKYKADALSNSPYQPTRHSILSQAIFQSCTLSTWVSLFPCFSPPGMFLNCKSSDAQHPLTWSSLARWRTPTVLVNLLVQRSKHQSSTELRSAVPYKITTVQAFHTRVPQKRSVIMAISAFQRVHWPIIQKMQCVSGHNYIDHQFGSCCSSWNVGYSCSWSA